MVLRRPLQLQSLGHAGHLCAVRDAQRTATLLLQRHLRSGTGKFERPMPLRALDGEMCQRRFLQLVRESVREGRACGDLQQAKDGEVRLQRWPGRLEGTVERREEEVVLRQTQERLHKAERERFAGMPVCCWKHRKHVRDRAGTSRAVCRRVWEQLPRLGRWFVSRQVRDNGPGARNGERMVCATVVLRGPLRVQHLGNA
mmetsp:Transcript_123080/g.347834  ORF Transcript_123080/g.347834 Transcript_123080/m.347834 type:complete len:200 (-) Transcript_123080:1113-1712(-)